MGPRRRPLSSGGASRSPERTPEGEDGGSGRRTAIWVAAITAVATVAAALVGVFAHGGNGEQSSPSAAPQSPRITPHESQSTSVQVTDFSVGQTATSRFVNVKGYVLALLGDNEIHAIAAPANGEPVERSGAGGAAVAHDAPTVHEVQRWYVSPPITLIPMGRGRHGSTSTRWRVENSPSRRSSYPIATFTTVNPSASTSLRLNPRINYRRRPPAPGRRHLRQRRHRRFRKTAIPYQRVWTG
jgi:hypothetical protein